MNEISLKVFPNTNKISKKNGKIPIYVRIIVNSIKAEGKIRNVSLSSDEIRLWNPMTQSLNDSKSPINPKLTKVRSRFDEFKSKHLYSDEKITAMKIRDNILEIDLEKKIVLQNDSVKKFIDDYYINEVEPSKNWSKSTKKIFKKSIKHFNNFLIRNQLVNVNFSELKPLFGHDFYRYLTSEYTDSKETSNKVEITIKTAISKASASQAIKQLKSIFKLAVLGKKLSENPFDGIKIKFQHQPKAKLNITEVSKLYEADLKSRPSLELCRDLFLFQILTGLAYIDMVSLKPSQIVATSGKKSIISFVRKKTKIGGQVVINKYTDALIEKFKKHPYVQAQGGIVPKINLQEYNNRLKLLVELFNLSIVNLSTHHGRHCFRQFLSEAEIVDQKAINTFMGWSTKGQMDSIYANCTEKQLIVASELLEVYLDNHLCPNEAN